MDMLPSSPSTSINGCSAPSNGLASPMQQRHEHPYGLPHDSDPVSSLSVSNGHSLPYNVHNEEIIQHLYQAGFQTGHYFDTILNVHQNSYRLHAIILSRSPFLAHLMSTTPPTSGQRVIYVQLDNEPEVTQEGFAIALGYLYSSISISLVRPDNARGVLAAGCLLGGMEDLCEYTYDTCRQSINLDTINEWLAFVDSIPGSDGSLSPEQTFTSVFGQYARRLRDDVFHYLVATLPNILGVNPSVVSESGPPQGKAGRETLLQIFSLVPFDMFKAAVESPAFEIGSDHSRFKFAKDAVELRKKGIAQGRGAEETVVLAFGGGHMGGSAVHVTRKMRKRPLWKVHS